jgi:hypothetical protein
VDIGDDSLVLLAAMRTVPIGVVLKRFDSEPPAKVDVGFIPEVRPLEWSDVADGYCMSSYLLIGDGQLLHELSVTDTESEGPLRPIQIALFTGLDDLVDALLGHLEVFTNETVGETFGPQFCDLID